MQIFKLRPPPAAGVAAQGRRARPPARTMASLVRRRTRLLLGLAVCDARSELAAPAPHASLIVVDARAGFPAWAPELAP